MKKRKKMPKCTMKGRRGMKESELKKRIMEGKMWRNGERKKAIRARGRYTEERRRERTMN